MNEIFTKTFWEGVKKTFDDALEGRDEAAETPVKADLPPLTTETQTPIQSNPTQP